MASWRRGDRDGNGQPDTPAPTAPGWPRSEQANRKPRQAGTEQLQDLALLPALSLPEGASRKRLPEKLPASLCFWLTSVPLDNRRVWGTFLSPEVTGESMPPLPSALNHYSKDLGEAGTDGGAIVGMGSALGPHPHGGPGVLPQHPWWPWCAS